VDGAVALLLLLVFWLLPLVWLLPGKIDSQSMLLSGAGMSPDCTKLKKSSTELFLDPLPYDFWLPVSSFPPRSGTSSISAPPCCW
jgi:hypothetical protein